MTSDLKVTTSAPKVTTFTLKVMTSDLKVMTSDLKVMTPDLNVMTSALNVTTSDANVMTSALNVMTFVAGIFVSGPKTRFAGFSVGGGKNLLHSPLDSLDGRKTGGRGVKRGHSDGGRGAFPSRSAT